MSDVEVRRIEDIEPYGGPGRIEGIRFRAAAAALGVTAWGMNVLELAPGCTGYPEHDHAKDGQEEAYLLLEGSASLNAGGKDYALEQGVLVRVAPGVKRKWTPGAGGATLLALGGVPGQAYEPRS